MAVCYNCKFLLLSLELMPCNKGKCVKHSKRHVGYIQKACTEFVNRYFGISSYGT